MPHKRKGSGVQDTFSRPVRLCHSLQRRWARTGHWQHAWPLFPLIAEHNEILISLLSASLGFERACCALKLLQACLEA